MTEPVHYAVRRRVEDHGAWTRLLPLCGSKVRALPQLTLTAVRATCPACRKALVARGELGPEPLEVAT